MVRSHEREQAKAPHAAGIRSTAGRPSPQNPDTAVKDYAKMTKAELIRRIAALEKTAPGPVMAFAHERLVHDLQVHQTELETQNRELRASEELLRAITDHTADIIAVKDSEGRYLFVNQAGCRSGGFSLEAAVGHTDIEFHTDREQALHFMADDRRIMESRQPEMIEEEFTVSGGEKCVLLTNKIPRMDAQGRVIGIIVVARNITARKRAEEALRESGERLALALGASEQGTWDWNVGTGELIFDEPAAAMLGYAPGEIEPDPGGWQKLIHPDDLPAVLAALRAHMEGRTSAFEAEYRMRHKSGVWMWLLDTGRIVQRDAEGRPLRVAGTHRDITARKQAEAALRKSEERLQLVLRASEIGMFEIDLVSGDTHWNEVEFELLGLQPGTAPAAPETFFRFLHPDDAGWLSAVWEKAKRTGEFDAEFRIVRADGAERWLAGEGRFVSTGPEAGGEPSRFLGVNYDITERKLAEEELRRSEASLSNAQRIAKIGNWDLDVRTGGLRWSDQIFEIFGIEKTKFGANYEAFRAGVHPDDRERVDEAVRAGLAGEAPAAVEHRVLLPDGTVKFVHELGEVTRDETGQPLRMTGTVMDITERKHAEEALESRRRQQQAVAELSQHAVAGRDLHRLIRDAVAMVPQVLGVEFCKLLELRHEAGDLLLRAGTGWKKNHVGRATVSAGRESQAGFTMIENRPVLVEDYALETRFSMPPLLAKHAVRSGVSVVIHTRGLPFGVLAAHSSQPRRFSGGDVHFIQTVANVLAAAIDRRDIEEELLKTSDNERARIGQDLHDDLCQQLTGIELRTEVLRLRLAGLPEAQEEVEMIGGYLRVATLHARTLAHGLSPVQLEASGLMTALRELAADMGGLFRVACVFRCESPVLMGDPFAATHLYRIAQEAISNAVRHGHAKNIVVSLAHGPAGGVLTVADDGTGCATPVPGSAGMGLRTMQYRSEMIGATLCVGPAEGGGTAVRCEFQTTAK